MDYNAVFLHSSQIDFIATHVLCSTRRKRCDSESGFKNIVCYNLLDHLSYKVIRSIQIVPKVTVINGHCFQFIRASNNVLKVTRSPRKFSVIKYLPSEVLKLLFLCRV